MRQETKSLSIVLRAEDCPAAGMEGNCPCNRYKNPRLSLEVRDLGELAPANIRVQILYVGVCGTDLHLIRANRETGYVLTSAPASIPRSGRVIGHEGVARILDVGRDVLNLRKGSLIGFASIEACMQCEACRRGAFNQCSRSCLLGMERDGLFANIADVPAAMAVDIEAAVRTEEDLIALVCLEPAAVALQACLAGGVSPGARVVIFGGGPIGILCAMISRLTLGATHITLVEPEPLRRKFARDWCDAVKTVEEYISDGGQEVDVLLEASGDMRNVERCFRKMAANGRVILLGRGHSKLEITATDHLITRAISIAGSRGHLGGALDRIVKLYSSGRLPLGRIITGNEGSLAELMNALNNPQSIQANHCKLVAKVN